MAALRTVLTEPELARVVRLGLESLADPERSQRSSMPPRERK